MIQNTNRREFEIFLNSCPDDLVEVPAVEESEGIEEGEKVEGTNGVEEP